MFVFLPFPIHPYIYISVPVLRNLTGFPLLKPTSSLPLPCPDSDSELYMQRQFFPASAHARAHTLEILVTSFLCIFLWPINTYHKIPGLIAFFAIHSVLFFFFWDRKLWVWFRVTPRQHRPVDPTPEKNEIFNPLYILYMYVCIYAYQFCRAVEYRNT